MKLILFSCQGKFFSFHLLFSKKKFLQKTICNNVLVATSKHHWHVFLAMKFELNINLVFPLRRWKRSNQTEKEVRPAKNDNSKNPTS